MKNLSDARVRTVGVKAMNYSFCCPLMMKATRLAILEFEVSSKAAGEILRSVGMEALDFRLLI